MLSPGSLSVEEQRYQSAISWPLGQPAPGIAAPQRHFTPGISIRLRKQLLSKHREKPRSSPAPYHWDRFWQGCACPHAAQAVAVPCCEAAYAYHCQLLSFQRKPSESEFSVRVFLKLSSPYQPQMYFFPCTGLLSLQKSFLLLQPRILLCTYHHRWSWDGAVITLCRSINSSHTHRAPQTLTIKPQPMLAETPCLPPCADQPQEVMLQQGRKPSTRFLLFFHPNM